MASLEVTFRTLKGTSFKLTALDTETVLDLKRKVGAHQSVDDYAGYRLIYKGKILEDSMTLAAASISASGFVVVMPPKKAPAKPTQSKPASSKPASTQTDVSSGTREASKTPEPTKNSGTSENLPASTSRGELAQPTSSNASNTLVTGPEYEASVRRICEMGFPEGEVKRAMRAAFNNPDRAVEFIFNGIPETPDLPAAANVSNVALDSRGHGDSPESSPNVPSEQQQSSLSSHHPNDGPETNLNALRNAPIFNQIRRLIQANPAALPQLLQYIDAANPGLMSLIEANQEEFSRLINEPVPDGNEVTDDALERLAQAFAGADDTFPPSSQDGRVYVTQEERDQITRLTELASNIGVSEGQVLQSWIACNRDEALTANYLVDNAEELRADQAEDATEDQPNNPSADPSRRAQGPPH